MYFAPWALPQTELSLAYVYVARAAEHVGDLELSDRGSVPRQSQRRAELRAQSTFAASQSPTC